MKKLLTFVAACVILFSLTSACVSHLDGKSTSVAYAEYFEEVEERVEYVYEIFEVTEVVTINHWTEVYGEIVASTDGSTGEGIYLDNTYGMDMTQFKEGQFIIVKYFEEDFKEDIWDNIQDVKILK